MSWTQKEHIRIREVEVQQQQKLTKMEDLEWDPKMLYECIIASIWTLFCFFIVTWNPRIIAMDLPILKSHGLHYVTFINSTKMRILMQRQNTID